MDLSNLVKTSKKSAKRIGRGHGSGKGGHTVGRGNFGQKSRENVSAIFEGTKFRKSLFKRLPLLKGKGKFKPSRISPIVVNLKYLNLFKENDEVNLKTLADKRIISYDEGQKFGVKILGEGEILLPLVIQLPISKGARKKIEKAGGKILEETAKMVKEVASPRILKTKEIKNRKK